MTLFTELSDQQQQEACGGEGGFIRMKADATAGGWYSYWLVGSDYPYTARVPRGFANLRLAKVEKWLEKKLGTDVIGLAWTASAPPKVGNSEAEWWYK
jgi:hypothetical protein